MDLATLQALGLAGSLSMATAGFPGMLGMQQQAAGLPAGGGPSGGELPANSPMHGTVKAWMDDKGFGFVTPAQGGPDVFVHKNQLTDGERLVQGSTVTFECRFNPSRRKYEATSCHGAQAAGAVAPPVQQVAPPTIGASGVPVPPPAPTRGAGEEGRDKDNLFVAGLPMDYNEERVKDLFSQYGTVTQCKLLPDQPGKNDKAALVRFQDENQAKWMVQNMHGNIPVGMTTPLIVRYAGERGGKLGTPTPGAGYGKAPGEVQDNRFSPYGQQNFGGLTGAGVDPNLAAALMQLVAPQAQQAGQLDAATLALLAAQGLGGATGGAAQQPAFDANALAAAAAGATAQAAITSGADAGAAQTAAAASQSQAAGGASAGGAAGGSWAEATDPSSGKTYYYHTVTRETRWEKPA